MLTPNAGSNVCPVCTFHFKKPLAVRWPEKVEWYKPQVMKLKCPHCFSLITAKQDIAGLFAYTLLVVILSDRYLFGQTIDDALIACLFIVMLSCSFVSFIFRFRNDKNGDAYKVDVNEK